MIRTILTIAAVVIALQCSGPAQAALDWQKVEQGLGRKAATMPGDVHRFGFPRSDLKVTLDGVTVKPALAPGSWLALKGTTDGAVFICDLGLTGDDGNPVLQ